MEKIRDLKNHFNGYGYRTNRTSYRANSDSVTFFSKCQSGIWSDTFDDLQHLKLLQKSWYKKIEKLWNLRIRVLLI